MCNCNTPPCSQCKNGQPCNCPPDFTVQPAQSQCQCCPNGYTFQQPSVQYPNGICMSTTGGTTNSWCCPPGLIYNNPSPQFSNGFCLNPATKAETDPIRCPATIPPIPCVLCENDITTDCVTYSGIVPIACGPPPGNIYGIVPGDTITTIIGKMCAINTSVIEAVYSATGLDTNLLSGFCQLVGGCLPAGSTVPIITSIIVTFP